MKSYTQADTTSRHLNKHAQKLTTHDAGHDYSTALTLATHDYSPVLTRLGVCHV
jgi:hypothetical protein